MGLGLPMVKNIIEAYGGSITYKTTLGKGTLFEVSSPKTNTICSSII
jgi:signal transduction histidine kinase